MAVDKAKVTDLSDIEAYPEHRLLQQ